MNLQDHIDSFLIDEKGKVIADLISEAYQSMSSASTTTDLDESTNHVLPTSILEQVCLIKSNEWTRVDKTEASSYYARKLPNHLLWQLVVKTPHSSRDGQITRLGSTAFTTAIHDLKNPLGAIYSYSDALLDPDMGFELPQPGKSIIEKIQKAANRTLDMLKNYESLFFMQRERSARSSEVNESLKEIIETSSHLLDESVTLEVKLADEELFVALSDFSLERILSNLLVNSFKYTEENGLITLRTLGKDDKVLIEVINSGPCISEEDQVDIFSFRKRGKTSGDQSGTGLGLYIAKKLVQGANGTLTLSIKEEEGNTFRVTLPKM